MKIVINMSVDYELFEEFKKELSDRYEAVELCELLGLDVWDLLESFEEKVLELQRR